MQQSTIALDDCVFKHGHLDSRYIIEVAGSGRRREQQKTEAETPPRLIHIWDAKWIVSQLAAHQPSDTYNRNMGGESGDLVFLHGIGTDNIGFQLKRGYSDTPEFKIPFDKQEELHQWLREKTPDPDKKHVYFRDCNKAHILSGGTTVCEREGLYKVRLPRPEKMIASETGYIHPIDEVTPAAIARCQAYSTFCDICSDELPDRLSNELPTPERYRCGSCGESIPFEFGKYAMEGQSAIHCRGAGLISDTDIPTDFRKWRITGNSIQTCNTND
jgi:hypothetical protein